MDEFIHEATKDSANKEELEVLFSTLMAMGLNIRFQDMENLRILLPLKWQMLNNGVCLLSLSNEHSQY